MAVAGNLRLWWRIAAGRHIAIEVIGFIRIADGIGPRITRGVGRPFIMDVGSAITFGAGAGHRTLFGVHLG